MTILIWYKVRRVVKCIYFSPHIEFHSTVSYDQLRALPFNYTQITLHYITLLHTEDN